MSVFTLYFQYQKRTSCLLGADLAGCGNDDANYGYGPLVGTLGDSLGGDGVPCCSNGNKRQSEGHESRVSVSGGGNTIQATPASPNLHESPSLTIPYRSYFQADIRPLKQSQR